jgi:hypothetical protein
MGHLEDWPGSMAAVREGKEARQHNDSAFRSSCISNRRRADTLNYEHQIQGRLTCDFRRRQISVQSQLDSCAVSMGMRGGAPLFTREHLLPAANNSIRPALTKSMA